MEDTCLYLNETLIPRSCLVNNLNIHAAVQLWNYDTALAGARYGPIQDWDTSLVTDMSYLFADYDAFNEDLSAWNTSAVVNMKSMFLDASAFNGNISSWDTSNVLDMSSMFQSAVSFNSPLSTLDTGAVTSMSFMFLNAVSFAQTNLSSWDTHSVLYMNGLFAGCSSFNGDVSTWNTSNVLVMTRLFGDAMDFNGDLSSWDTQSTTDMSNMFGYASSFNTDISDWNTAKVKFFSDMFNGASSFNQDISKWTMANAHSIANMFYNTSSFEQSLCWVDIPESIISTSTFCGSKGGSLNALCVPSLTFYDSQNCIRNAVHLWFTDQGVANNWYGPIQMWDTSQVTDMQELFQYRRDFNADISGWDTSSVVNMRHMFYGAMTFDIDISSWDTSNVRMFTSMFHRAVSFDQDISNWDMSHAIDTRRMFLLTSSFDQELCWELDDKVMASQMFCGSPGIIQEACLMNSFQSVSSTQTCPDDFLYDPFGFVEDDYYDDDEFEEARGDVALEVFVVASLITILLAISHEVVLRSRRQPLAMTEMVEDDTESETSFGDSVMEDVDLENHVKDHNNSGNNDGEERVESNPIANENNGNNIERDNGSDNIDSTPDENKTVNTDIHENEEAYTSSDKEVVNSTKCKEANDAEDTNKTIQDVTSGTP